MYRLTNFDVIPFLKHTMGLAHKIFVRCIKTYREFEEKQDFDLVKDPVFILLYFDW
ncbi:hypothetical protein ACWGOQ_0015920 [Aquimarina sp. M1]